MNSRDKKLPRRKFLRTSAAGLGAVAAWHHRLAPAAVLGANDRVRLGAIGTGGRCQDLMADLKKLPGNQITAVCDVYEPNLLEAREIAGSGAKQYQDYRALLDDKEIDAVIIGSPDHWHKQMTVDAVRAGKDVYVEKPVSHSLEEGVELVRVVEDSKRVVQTGTQQRSWEHFKLGKQIVDSGKLGQVTFIRAWWFQNYAAQRAPAKLALEQLDRKRWLGPAPDQPLTPMKFYRWRWYWDFGGGALTDLMTHWIDVVHWYMETPAPLSALTSGNRYSLSWECPDTITCVLDYPKNYSVTYHSAMTSSIDDGGMELRGTEATMKIDRQRLAVYAEGGKLIGNKEEQTPEILIRSRGDGTLDHLGNFLECIRSRRNPTANVQVAHAAARAAHLGNLSLKRERRVRWNSQLERVEA